MGEAHSAPGCRMKGAPAQTGLRPVGLPGQNAQCLPMGQAQGFGVGKRDLMSAFGKKRNGFPREVRLLPKEESPVLAGAGKSSFPQVMSSLLNSSTESQEGALCPDPSLSQALQPPSLSQAESMSGPHSAQPGAGTQEVHAARHTCSHVPAHTHPLISLTS